MGMAIDCGSLTRKDFGRGVGIWSCWSSAESVDRGAWSVERAKKEARHVIVPGFSFSTLNALRPTLYASACGLRERDSSGAVGAPRRGPISEGASADVGTPQDAQWPRRRRSFQGEAD